MKLSRLPTHTDTVRMVVQSRDQLTWDSSEESSGFLPNHSHCHNDLTSSFLNDLRWMATLAWRASWCMPVSKAWREESGDERRMLLTPWETRPAQLHTHIHKHGQMDTKPNTHTGTRAHTNAFIHIPHINTTTCTQPYLDLHPVQ